MNDSLVIKSKVDHATKKLPFRYERAGYRCHAPGDCESIIKPIHHEAAKDTRFYFVRAFVVNVYLLLMCV